MKGLFSIIEDLLIQNIPFLGKIFGVPKYEFGWIIHPRNEADFARKFKSHGNFIIKFSRFLWPFRAGEIKILSANGVKEKKGCIIAIPLTTKQILSNEKLSEKRIFKSIKLAEALGVKNLGAAGIAGVIIEKKKDKFKTLSQTKIHLTNGFTLLLAVAFDKISSLINKYKSNLKEIRLGVIGATSVLGQPFTKLLAESNLDIQKITLFGKTPQNLASLKKEITNANSHSTVEITTDLAETKKCNFLVVAINSLGAVIEQKNLALNTIILDITQPPNKYIQEIKKIKERRDLMITDNLLINTPDVEYDLDIGIPPAQSYVCVGETLLSLKDSEGYKRAFPQEGISKIDLKTIAAVKNFLLKYYDYTK
ncbi:MAG: hypothetical protein AAB911_00420 [Patescibacteria group bacterium]